MSWFLLACLGGGSQRVVTSADELPDEFYQYQVKVQVLGEVYQKVTTKYVNSAHPLADKTLAEVLKALERVSKSLKAPKVKGFKDIPEVMKNSKEFIKRVSYIAREMLEKERVGNLSKKWHQESNEASNNWMRRDEAMPEVVKNRLRSEVSFVRARSVQDVAEEWSGGNEHLKEAWLKILAYWK